MSPATRAPEPADLVAEAVTDVPGVAGLRSGQFGDVATYLAGRRVRGVRLSDDGGAEIHVAVTYGASVTAVAEQVRAAVSTVVSGPVDVVVEDVVSPDDPGPEAPPALPAATADSPPGARAHRGA